MADLTAARAKHATLTTTTADKITLSANDDTIIVVNRHASEILTVTFNAAAAPTAAMDDAYVIPGGKSLTVPYPAVAPVVVRIIGNGNAYSVMAARSGTEIS